MTSSTETLGEPPSPLARAFARPDIVGSILIGIVFLAAWQWLPGFLGVQRDAVVGHDRCHLGSLTLTVLGKGSRYAKNPLWLLAAHLHRASAMLASSRYPPRLSP